jgi:tetratricopeptide (TPR) repeat protein
MQRYQQALSIWRRLANRSGEAYTLNNIGLIQAANRNFRAALASYSAARKMLTELEEKRGLSYASNNAAAAHAELREWDQAEALYTEGLQRSRDIGDRNGEATSLAGIARMRLDQKDAQGAVDPAQRAVELRKGIVRAKRPRSPSLPKQSGRLATQRKRRATTPPPWISSKRCEASSRARC